MGELHQVQQILHLISIFIMYIYTGSVNLIFENIFSVIKKTVNTFSIFEKSFFKNKKLRAHINKIKFTKSDHTYIYIYIYIYIFDLFRNQIYKVRPYMIHTHASSNSSTRGGNFLQSEYLLFHKDCMPILGINHFTGENTRDERRSTYLSFYQ